MKKYWIFDVSFLIWNLTYGIKTKCCDDGCEACEFKTYSMLKTSTGVITGGLYGLFNKIIDKMNNGYEIILAFDPPRSNLDRTKLLDTYKAQRIEKPDFISNQMKLAKELFTSIPNISCYTSDVCESDDVMSTLAVKYATNGNEVIIESKDKDMYPLLDIPNINIFKNNELYTKESFFEEFGFNPNRFNEFLALAGDAADNFKILKGIGSKTAIWLIKHTNHIYDIYKDKYWNDIPLKYKKMLAEIDSKGNIIKNRLDDIKLAMQLSTLNYDANCIDMYYQSSKYVFKNKVESLELRNVIDHIDMLFD